MQSWRTWYDHSRLLHNIRSYPFPSKHFHKNFTSRNMHEDSICLIIFNLLVLPLAMGCDCKQYHSLKYKQETRHPDQLAARSLFLYTVSQLGYLVPCVRIHKYQSLLLQVCIAILILAVPNLRFLMPLDTLYKHRCKNGYSQKYMILFF